MIGSFLLATISFISLDLIWLGFVMKDFNLRHLAEIGRIENGEFQVLYVPAILTYILMALAVSFFVLPRLPSLAPGMQVFGVGALMGLIIYGVFDLTNLAILRNYPLPFVFADIAWGTFVFGIVSLIVRNVTRQAF